MLECMYGGNYELGPEDIAELYWVTADMLPGEKKGNKASRRKQYAYEHRLYLASRKHFDIILATSPDIIVVSRPGSIRRFLLTTSRTAYGIAITSSTTIRVHPRMSP